MDATDFPRATFCYDGVASNSLIDLVSEIPSLMIDFEIDFVLGVPESYWRQEDVGS